MALLLLFFIVISIVIIIVIIDIIIIILRDFYVESALRYVNLFYFTITSVDDTTSQLPVHNIYMLHHWNGTRGAYANTCMFTNL